MTQSAPEPGPLAPVAPAAPQRELGYAAESPAEWWGSLTSERVPELRWPAAYDVYDQMMDNAQVSSVAAAVIMPILRTGWRIDGTDCDPDITRHVADDLAVPIVGEGNKLSDTTIEDRFSWEEHLATALPEMVSYGHSFYEQKAYLGGDGRWHLHKLGYRPPRTITKINVARDGGLVSIEQSGNPRLLVSPGSGSAASSGSTNLSVARIVVYCRGRKGSNWRGRSLLRPAYQPWLLNQRAARVEMIVAERVGSPVPVYTDSENGTAETLLAGQKIATGVRSGQKAGAALPYGATLRLLGYEGQLPDVEKIKRYNDEQVARAVLAHFLNLGTETGSWALGSTFADFFTLSLQAVADEIARTASRHVVRDIVEWNWPGARSPRLVFDEIGSRRDAIVHALAQLVQAGVLKPDEDLEQFTRTALGLPPRDPTQPAPAPAADPQTDPSEETA